jgi:hypothetical protein
MQTIHFGQNDSRDDVKSLLAARFEVMFGLSAVQAVEQFPGGICQPEKRLSAGSDEEIPARIRVDGFESHKNSLAG